MFRAKIQRFSVIFFKSQGTNSFIILFNMPSEYSLDFVASPNETIKACWHFRFTQQQNLPVPINCEMHIYYKISQTGCGWEDLFQNILKVSDFQNVYNHSWAVLKLYHFIHLGNGVIVAAVCFYWGLVVSASIYFYVS